MTSSSPSLSSPSTAADASKAIKRLGKEFSALSSSLPSPISSLSLVDNSLLHWTVIITSPPSSPYSSGKFTLDFTFPPSYPHQPPTVRFATPIYHPNVSMKSNGAICNEIISKDWAPTLKVENLVERIFNLMENPNMETPLDAEVAEVYAKSISKFNETAKAWTKKHAME